MIDYMPGAEKLTDDDVILITGGNGCYGNGVRIAKEKLGLKGKWIFLGGRKEADLTKMSDVEAVFEKYKPTYVIHLAAIVGGLFHQMQHKVEYWEQNSAMNNNVLVCADKYNAKKCVNCISTVAVPGDAQYPVTEKTEWNTRPHPSNDAYGFSKRMLHYLGTWFNEKNENDKSKTKFISIMPSNLYGPFDDFNTGAGHVVPSFIRRCNDAIQANKNKKAGEPEEKLLVMGSGKAQRQFLYSIDGGELAIWAMLNYDDLYEPIIFAPEEEVEIGFVAKTVCEAMGLTSGVQFDTTKSDGVLRRTAESYKLKDLFPNFKYTPFKDGVKECADWYIKNEHIARK